MIEEKILNAVSEATGVAPHIIKSGSSQLEDVRARMMYYYLCDEKRLLSGIIGDFVGRTASAVSKGVASFKVFISDNEKYMKLTENARRIMLGADIGEQREWMHHEGQEYIYVGGKKYSILDMSSRYYGEGYMGLIDDEYVLYNENKEQAVKMLVAMTDK